MNILSLGAGVQSTTLLLMSLHGDLPLFDAAIFADTGAEPAAVYEHLDWLEAQVCGRFPVHRVHGGDIEQDVIDALDSGLPTGHIGHPPFYVRERAQVSVAAGRAPDLGGMLWRKCTKDYKLLPVRRKVRELYESNNREHVMQFIGISYDEISRIRESGVKYITNVYALVERQMRREDCLKWIAARGYPEPPKSACFFCPYMSGARWRQMKERDPETFARAVEFDHAIRRGKLPGVTGDVYLHRSFIPLEQAVRTDADDGQERLFDPYGFENECEGLCGV